MKVDLAIDGFGDRRFTGTIERINPPELGRPSGFSHAIAGQLAIAYPDEYIATASKAARSHATTSESPASGDASRTRRPLRRSPIEVTLEVIGDRWSFMVIREAFFGIRRFDDLQNKLGIAPNILARRLKALTAAGLLRKRHHGWYWTDRRRASDLADIRGVGAGPVHEMLGQEILPGIQAMAAPGLTRRGP